MNPDLRKRAIGGSEIGAIFEVDENRTGFDVAVVKKGLVEPPAPTLRMVKGKFLEEGALKLYGWMTGRKVEYVDQTALHPERPYMVYTIDGLCCDERRIVEVKDIAWDQQRNWGHEADEIPMRYQLQCQWYMSAKDYDVCDLFALIAGEPRIITIERFDRDAETHMLARAEEWWQRYIVGDELPPIGRSRLANDWLQTAFAKYRKADIQQANERETQLLDALLDIRRTQLVAKRQRAELENEIKLLIADREGLEWERGKFTWRKSKDSEVVAWERLAIAVIYNFIKDENARNELIAEYTSTKKGTRRVRVTDYSGEDDEE